MGTDLLLTVTVRDLDGEEHLVRTHTKKARKGQGCSAGRLPESQWPSLLRFVSVSVCLCLSDTHFPQGKNHYLSVLSQSLRFYILLLPASASLGFLHRPVISFSEGATGSLPPGLEEAREAVLAARWPPLPGAAVRLSVPGGGQADKGPSVTSFQHLLSSPFAQTHPLSWSI